MKIRKTLLRTLARRWPSSFGKDHYKYQVDSDTYHNRYFWDRYRQITQQGLPVNFHGRRVLDLGCGEGATSHFLARNYASVVVGIDIFFDPQAVLHEAYRVLAVGGFLNIPIFSSILSKYGAHMKTYIKLPWCNVIFSERVVLEVLADLALENPKILEDYPALNNDPLPTKIREIRLHHDLNDITYPLFIKMAEAAGFIVVQFNPQFPRTGRIGRSLSKLRVPYLRDVLSLGASALLCKTS